MHVAKAVLQYLCYLPGQTHLNFSENIRRVFNFTLPYAQTNFSQLTLNYCKRS